MVYPAIGSWIHQAGVVPAAVCLSGEVRTHHSSGSSAVMSSNTAALPNVRFNIPNLTTCPKEMPSLPSSTQDHSDQEPTQTHRQFGINTGPNHSNYKPPEIVQRSCFVSNASAVVLFSIKQKILCNLCGSDRKIFSTFACWGQNYSSKNFHAVKTTDFRCTHVVKGNCELQRFWVLCDYF